MIKYKDIYCLPTYPDDGNHLECDIGLPFEIRKGEDGYYYLQKSGKERKYNLPSYNKIDDRWIVNLKGDKASPSLIQMFDIKVNRDLDKIIDYCVNLYKKSLVAELERIKKELKEYE